MRWRAITREAWRNVVSGTSRAGIVAVVLVTAAVGLLLTDLFAVRGIVDRVDEFRSAGADVLVFSAASGVDPVRCEGIASAPGVHAAGAVRRDPDRYISTMPGSSIPTYEVSPGFAAVVHAAPAEGVGVVLSRELATTLQVVPGGGVHVLADGSGPAPTRVAGVYDYPADGRMSGFGFAMLVPTLDHGPFDACWVRQWPQSAETEVLLRSVAVADAGTDATPPELTQLNTSLGRQLDARALFLERPTRWLPLVGLLVAAAVGFAVVRLRRLEIASARHLRVPHGAQVLGVVLESCAWAVPVLLVGALAGAWVASSGVAADRGSTMALAMLAPIGVVLGGIAGSVLGVVSVRERALLRYLKER